jgi:O-antigen ligase
MPVFFLSIKHSTNAILFFLAITSLVYINKKYRTEPLRKFTKNNYLVAIFVFVFPILAIVISQILRFEFYPNNWDSPLRIFICLPIFLAISQGCISEKNSRTITEIWLCWSLPIAIFVALITRIYYPSKNWGVYKTTYFVDPQSFCSYALLFSTLSAIGLIYFNKKLSRLNIILSILSIIVGLYLSITTGARTGWLGFPIIMIIFWRALKLEFNIKKASILISIMALVITALLCYNNSFIIKLSLGYEQFFNYKLNELNEDTSVGMRLSIYRMGLQYFIEKPWYGWGDLSWIHSMNRPDFMQYASEFTRESPRHGFHNEIITSSVRSGIWGLIASVFLFAGVFYLAIKGMCININLEHSAISLALIVVIVHLFFSGLTTEITNLTFLSAFIGITVAVLLGEKICLEESNCKEHT